MSRDPLNTAADTEVRYRQLLDTAPDAMIVVDSDGTMAFANLQTERIFGYTRDELLGRPLDVLIPARFRAGHSAHMGRFFSRPATRSMGSGLELFGCRKDGIEIPIEVSLSPVRTGDSLSVCAAIRDITERKRIEGEARLNADRLASAVETIEDAFALFDAEDNLVLCNSVYRGLLGDSTTGPLVGRRYESLLDAWISDLDFSSEEERAQFRADRLAGRRNPDRAFDVRTRTGRRLRVMDRRTVEGGIVKTIWDLTEDVRLSEELREARAAAEGASAAKSEFLSSMSHELRTPMNAILGFAQLLEHDKKEPLSNRHRERVAHILRGGEHLLRLIDDILDLSRIEGGHVSLSSEPVSALEVLKEVRATLEPAASRARVTIDVAEAKEPLPPVRADRTRFAQIVMNFASNAVKYNRAGGSVTLSADLQPDGDTLRITVKDTGIGVPQEKQGKLFQPFQRAGQETGPIEGTGIGLVISQRLAELMGGTVGFRSAPGVGSEFWAELATVANEALSPLRPSATDDSGAGLTGSAGLVLYVEDNPANVTFIRDVLSDFEGVELAIAPTAEMGVELARSRRPDVILMDINLPGMSGLDALRILREGSQTRQIPVIALTAAATDRDKQRGAQAGFYRYLTKPVKLEELVSALGELLAHRSASGAKLHQTK
jgi:PAS domain S-box-containing protein